MHPTLGPSSLNGPISKAISTVKQNVKVLSLCSICSIFLGYQIPEIMLFPQPSEKAAHVLIIYVRIVPFCQRHPPRSL